MEFSEFLNYKSLNLSLFNNTESHILFRKGFHAIRQWYESFRKRMCVEEGRKIFTPRFVLP